MAVQSQSGGFDYLETRGYQNILKVCDCTMWPFPFCILLGNLEAPLLNIWKRLLEISGGTSLEYLETPVWNIWKRLLGISGGASLKYLEAPFWNIWRRLLGISGGVSSEYLEAPL